MKKEGIKIKMERRKLGEKMKENMKLRWEYKVKGIEKIKEKESKIVGKEMIGMEYMIRS